MPAAGSARKVDRRILVRALAVLATGVSISSHRASLELFSSWPQLRELDPKWLVPAVLFEVVSFLSV